MIAGVSGSACTYPFDFWFLSQSVVVAVSLVPTDGLYFRPPRAPLCVADGDVIDRAPVY